VDSSLQDNDTLAGQLADDQLSGVTGHTGQGKVRDVRIGYLVRIGDLIGQRIQPRSQEETHLR